MGEIDTNVDSRQVVIVDTLKEHQSKAGKVGGKSRTEAKVLAARANLIKAQMSRRRSRGMIIPNNSKVDMIDILEVVKGVDSNETSV